MPLLPAAVRLVARTPCPWPTQSCLAVPRYGVPVGKSSNALWTRGAPLPAMVCALPTPHRDGVNVRFGGGTAVRAYAAGMDAVIPSDAWSDTPPGLGPCGVSDMDSHGHGLRCFTSASRPQHLRGRRVLHRERVCRSRGSQVESADVFPVARAPGAYNTALVTFAVSVWECTARAGQVKESATRR